MSTWPELEAVIAAMPPEQATLALLRFMFAKLAEIDGELHALTPVVGAMAGRLGITGEDIRRLAGEA